MSLEDIEAGVFRALNHAGELPWLDWAVETLPVPIFTVAIAGILWRAAPGCMKVRVATGLAVLLFLLVLVLLCSEFKDAIGRLRPGQRLEAVRTGGREWTGPSFPSCNAALWGGVTGLIPLLRAGRAICGALAGAAALFSLLRVYQGAHWLSDVLAGFALGWGLAVAWTVVLRGFVMRTAAIQP